MINFGQAYSLQVNRIIDNGAFLDAQEQGEILLPRKYMPDGLSVSDSVYVFLYFDSEDRPVATTQLPFAYVGQFAYLEVVASTKVGAFLDWGLDKDVLVPFAEQHRPMQDGHSYLVFLYLDKLDGRIVASSKIDKFIDETSEGKFRVKQEVDLIIANSTELGFKAIINHSQWGVLFKNEVFQRLSFGQSIKGYIKTVREDGKIDLSLDGGKVTRDKNATKILAYLEEHDGFVGIHDKSDPSLILATFSMSKGAFKKSIGTLYKQRLINIEKTGIRLIEKEPAP